MANIGERHPWTADLTPVATTAPRNATDDASRLWTVQLPSTVDASVLDKLSWIREGDAWTASVDGTAYVMEPVTSGSPWYVVDDGAMLPVERQMVVRVVVGEYVREDRGVADKRKKKRKSKHSS